MSLSGSQNTLGAIASVKPLRQQKLSLSSTAHHRRHLDKALVHICAFSPILILFRGIAAVGQASHPSIFDLLKARRIGFGGKKRSKAPEGPCVAFELSSDMIEVRASVTKPNTSTAGRLPS